MLSYPVLLGFHFHCCQIIPVATMIFFDLWVLMECLVEEKKKIA